MSAKTASNGWWSAARPTAASTPSPSARRPIRSISSPPIEFDTRTIRFTYSSPATPKQTFDYDLESRERVLRKQQKVPSGHDPSAYVVRRLAATTADNEQVPITVLHRKGLPLDGSAPLFLEGYGAYSCVFPTAFDSNILSLVDRGFVYAIAHVRGGIGEGRALAQCRPARQQGQHVQRFHRGRPNT